MTSTQDERDSSIPRYNNKKVGALATVLFEAFKRAEPDHGISKHPTSYLATFADMAHAALVQFPSMLAPDTAGVDIKQFENEGEAALRKRNFDFSGERRGAPQTPATTEPAIRGDEVERMARALCAADPVIRMGDAEGVVQQRVDREWPNYEGQARAALAAIRSGVE